MGCFALAKFKYDNGIINPNAVHNTVLNLFKEIADCIKVKVSPQEFGFIVGMQSQEE
jgi:hypothetical protein